MAITTDTFDHRPFSKRMQNLFSENDRPFKKAAPIFARMSDEYGGHVDQAQYPRGSPYRKNPAIIDSYDPNEKPAKPGEGARVSGSSGSSTLATPASRARTQRGATAGGCTRSWWSSRSRPSCRAACSRCVRQLAHREDARSVGGFGGKRFWNGCIFGRIQAVVT